MKIWKLNRRVLVVIGNLGAIYAMAQTAPLSITTPSCPAATQGSQYSVQLLATGGIAPYRWEITEGRLPTGLQLASDSGVISGVATEVGELEFTAAVRDSASPPNRVQRKFSIRVNAAMLVSWKQTPQIRDGGIWGAVEVTNNTATTFDLTVIILAVNDVGKAFALGYQHFPLAPQKVSPAIQFGSSLPFGSYVLNVDAIGEVASVNRIYRVHMEWPTRLTIQQP
jgi:hypothetical protein